MDPRPMSVRILQIFALPVLMVLSFPAAPGALDEHCSGQGLDGIAKIVCADPSLKAAADEAQAHYWAAVMTIQSAAQYKKLASLGSMGQSSYLVCELRPRAGDVSACMLQAINAFNSSLDRIIPMAQVGDVQQADVESHLAGLVQASLQNLLSQRARFVRQFDDQHSPAGDVGTAVAASTQMLAVDHVNLLSDTLNNNAALFPISKGNPLEFNEKMGLARVQFGPEATTTLVMQMRAMRKAAGHDDQDDVEQ